MAFKDMVSKMRERSDNRKELIRDLDEKVRIQNLVEDRQKSANERELNRFINEEREKNISEQLEIARKQKDHDIKFNHNPLDVQNITNKTQWSVMKEKNQFTNKKSMFSDQPLIHKSNPKLLQNAKWLMK